MTNTRFSTAVHVLVELAKNPKEQFNSSQLAAKLGTHPVVVRRLVALLKQAELVTSTKGAKGGVRLAIKADEIPLSQVAELTDENLGFETHNVLSELAVSNPFTDAVLTVIEAERRKVHLAAISYLDGISIKNVLETSVLRCELTDLVARGMTDEQIRMQYHIEDGHLVKK
jgi:Rrf2 family protein